MDGNRSRQACPRGWRGKQEEVASPAAVAQNITLGMLAFAMRVAAIKLVTTKNVVHQALPFDSAKGGSSNAG